MTPDQQSDAAQQPAAGSHRKLIGIVVGCLVLLLIAAGLVYLGNRQSGGLSDPHREALSQGFALLGGGDFSGALAVLRGTYDSMPADMRQEGASPLLRLALARSGEQADRIEAIRLAKQEYAAASGDNVEQARIVNAIIGYITPVRDPNLYTEIFSGEPFESFRVEGDAAVSIQRLAEHSYSLAPTAEAIFKSTAPHVDGIRDGAEGSDERAAHAAAVLAAIDQAALVFADERAAEQGPFAFMLEPRYHYWRAYLYGMVARVQPEYLGNARQALSDLVALYESDRANMNAPLISTFLPYAHFQYAVAVRNVQGEEEATTARRHLAQMMDIVDAAPDVHEGGFLSIVRYGASLPPEIQEQEFTTWIRFAESNPRFKAWLEGYGWTFSS